MSKRLLWCGHVCPFASLQPGRKKNVPGAFSRKKAMSSPPIEGREISRTFSGPTIFSAARRSSSVMTGSFTTGAGPCQPYENSTLPRIPEATAEATSPIRRARNSRISWLKARTVPVMRHSPGMMLKALPAWISPRLITHGS